MEPEAAGALAGGTIGYLFIFVRDLAMMTSFYRDTLGFTLRYHQPEHFAFLHLGGGGPQIAFYPGRQPSVHEHNHWFIAIDVEDIDSVVLNLKKLGVPVGSIGDVPNGRAATFDDPEGNTIEIHEPAKASA